MTCAMPALQFNKVDVIVALYILLALIGVGCVLRLTHRPDEPDKIVETVVENDDQCCGRHAVCEKFADAALNQEPIYFDDEELDAFAGRDSQSYTSDEVDAFRDVLFTLLPHDLAPWAHSLELRKIALPSELRDEYLMLLSEQTQLEVHA